MPIYIGSEISDCRHTYACRNVCAFFNTNKFINRKCVCGCVRMVVVGGRGCGWPWLWVAVEVGGRGGRWTWR